MCQKKNLRGRILFFLKWVGFLTLFEYDVYVTKKKKNVQTLNPMMCIICLRTDE